MIKRLNILFSATILNLLFLTSTIAQEKKLSFGFHTSCLEADYTKQVSHYSSFKSALNNPEQVVSVQIAASDDNLGEIRKLTNLKLGLLVNFNVNLIKDGIIRIANKL